MERKREIREREKESDILIYIYIYSYIIYNNIKRKSVKQYGASV